MQKGYKLLDAHSHKEALKVGQRLGKLRHSSTFEIMALAYQQAGKPSKAIAILETGISKAGRVWLLWELLGNFYSDAGRFEEAERVYQQALLREGCNLDVVHLNRAIAFNRAGKPLAALAAIEGVNSKRLFRRVQACLIRIKLLVEKKREALRLASKLFKLRHFAGENYDEETESEILLACALAFSHSPKTRLKARRLALRAIDWNPSSQEALAIIRSTAPESVAMPLLFRCLVRGAWNAPIGRSRIPPGFFRSFVVAASGKEEILEYLKPFFPSSIRPSLSIEETERLSSTDAIRPGVYSVSGRMFFPLRKPK